MLAGVTPTGLSMLAVDTGRRSVEAFGDPLPVSPDDDWTALYWNSEYSRATALIAAGPEATRRVFVSDRGGPWSEVIGSGAPIRSASVSEASSVLFLRYETAEGEPTIVEMATRDDELIHRVETDEIIGQSSARSGPRDAYLLWTQRTHEDATYNYWRFDRRTGNSNLIFGDVWSSRVLAFPTSLIYEPAGAPAVWIDLDGAQIDVPGFRPDGYLSGHEMWLRDGVLELSDRQVQWHSGALFDDEHLRCASPRTGYEVLADRRSLSWSGPSGAGTFESPTSAWRMGRTRWCKLEGRSKAIYFDTDLDPDFLKRPVEPGDTKQRFYVWYLEHDEQPRLVGSRSYGGFDDSPNRLLRDGTLVWLEDGQLRLVTPETRQPAVVALPEGTRIVSEAL